MPRKPRDWIYENSLLNCKESYLCQRSIRIVSTAKAKRVEGSLVNHFVLLQYKQKLGGKKLQELFQATWKVGTKTRPNC